MDSNITINELIEENKKLKNDLSLLNLLQNRLDDNELFLKLLLDTIPSPVFYKDKNGIYQHCNNAFSKTILGIDKEKIIGKSLFDLPEYIPTELALIYSKKDQELFINPGTQFYEAKVRCADGVQRYFNFYKATCLSIENEIIGLVGVMLDVTDYKNIENELKDKNIQLEKLTCVDDLTDLYNRRYFEQIFKMKISDISRFDKKFSLALIDIDYFKDFNDKYGHLEGDIALKEISNILINTFNRTNDFVFRIGGEEFGVLFDVKSSEDVKIMVERLIENIALKRIKTCNKNVSQYLTVSIGATYISNCEKKYEDIKELIYKKTDDLLYLSKQNGRNQYNLEEISIK